MIGIDIGAVITVNSPSTQPIAVCASTVLPQYTVINGLANKLYSFIL